jgi:hypothetical protein
VEARPGLLPHFGASDRDLLLYLFANCGNKEKKYNVREQYLPLEQVRARVRLPEGRTAKGVQLLRAGESVPWDVHDGWAEVVVPRILIHEIVHIELS